MTPLPILRAERFSIDHTVLLAVSTRQGGVSPEPFGMNLSFHVGDTPQNVTKNRALFFSSLGIGENELAIPKQVHSAVVKIADRPGAYEHCDALVTNRRRLFLCVSVADCVPMFLYDTKRWVVAAIHAGWRGTLGRIVEHAVEVMTEELACSPSDMIAFLGPSARSCCYTVGEEVALQFESSHIRNVEGKSFLDLVGCNLAQLRRSGIPTSAIEVAQWCTICNPDRFHSYRRDREKSGRMMGVIGLL